MVPAGGNVMQPQRLLAVLALIVACVFPVIVYFQVLDNELWPVHHPYAAWVSPTQPRRLHPEFKFVTFFTMGSRLFDRTHDQQYQYDLKGASPSYGPFTYRPVNYVLNTLQFMLAGGRPELLRLSSLVVYSVDTILVFFIMHLLSRQMTIASLATILYAVEIARERSMYDIGTSITVFYFSAVLFYLLGRGAARPRAGQAWLLLSFLCAALSEFNYEHSITLPFILAAIEWYQTRVAKRWRSQPLWLLLYLALPVADVFIRLHLYGGMTGAEVYSPRYFLTLRVAERFATYLVWHFVPNWIEIRGGIRTMIFGRLSGGQILALHPLAVSLLIVIALGGALAGLFLLSRSQMARRLFAREETKGLLGVGAVWGVMNLLISLPTSYGSNRMVLSAVGACLIKAVVIDGLARAVQAVTLQRAALGLLASLLVAHNIITVAPRIQHVELSDAITRTVFQDMHTILERTPPSRRVTLHLLNYPGGIGEQLPANAEWFSEKLSHRLNRPGVTVRTPYVLSYRDIGGYRQMPPIHVTQTEPGTFVIERPDAVGLNVKVAFLNLDSSLVRAGVRFSNNGFYTVLILDHDEMTGETSRFTLTLHPIPEDEIRLVLQYDHGTLRPL